MWLSLTHTLALGLYENTVAPVGPFLGPFSYLPACVDTDSWAQMGLAVKWFHEWRVHVWRALHVVFVLIAANISVGVFQSVTVWQWKELHRDLNNSKSSSCRPSMLKITWVNTHARYASLLATVTSFSHAF